MKNVRTVSSILLFLAAIGFFIASIITRQTLYPIGFLFLISGMGLSRRERDNSGEDSKSEDSDPEDSSESSAGDDQGAVEK